MSRQPVSTTREERDERGKTRETRGVAEGNLRFAQFFSSEVCLNESCANFWNEPESSVAQPQALKSSGPDHHPGCVGNAATSVGPHLCPDRLSEVTVGPGRWSYKYRHWLQPHPESWLLLQIPLHPLSCCSLTLTPTWLSFLGVRHSCACLSCGPSPVPTIRSLPVSWVIVFFYSS